MNIVLNQSHYGENMWALLSNMPDTTRFLLRGNGLYLTQTEAEKLALLNNVYVVVTESQQLGVTLGSLVTPCSLSDWIEGATNSTWATF